MPMKSFGLILLLLAALLAGEGRAASDAQARLTIGDDVYRVPVGKPFSVMLDGERVTMRLEIEETKSFAELGVEFKYPSAFSAERNDRDEGVTVWTMQGRSAAVVLQKYDEALDPDSLTDAIASTIVERYGEDRIERKSVRLRGVDRAYKGLRLLIAADEDDPLRTETEQNLFAFENTEGLFTLIVQDAREPGAKGSDEFRELVRLLGESFDGGTPPERDEEEGDEEEGDEEEGDEEESEDEAPADEDA